MMKNAHGDLPRTRATGTDNRSAEAGKLAGEEGRFSAHLPGQMPDEVEMDTLSSNTVSNNCNDLSFKLLRFGVDSLYLSYPGELKPDVEEKLKTLKKVAQSSEPHQQVGAQYALLGHFFEVKDKGAPLFPYILEDNCFRIQLSRGGKVPMAYVKVSSEYLSHVGPVDAEKALKTILDELGDIHETANVSRIDLFADFSSNVDMEGWGRRAWVTRASSVNAYAVDDQFSGWAIGLGSPIAARLYDKLLEIAKSQKSYLFSLWKEAGWEINEPVLRLEFEIKRETLAQLGVIKLHDVLSNLNGLWSYATTEWLKLTLPSDTDKTRSRWPIHPLWLYLSSIDWQTNGGPLTREFSAARIPRDEKLFSMGFSYLISFMARERITDFQEGADRFMAALYTYHDQKSLLIGLPFDQYIVENVRIKARKFNSMQNPESEAVLKEVLLQGSDAYRKASNGG